MSENDRFISHTIIATIGIAMTGDGVDGIGMIMITLIMDMDTIMEEGMEIGIDKKEEFSQLVSSPPWNAVGIMDSEDQLTISMRDSS